MADPDESGSGSSADFDFAYFDAYTSGDEALQREVLQLFFGQVDSLLERLDPAGSREDWQAGAHAIKGGARGVGLGVVGDLCQQMEDMKDEDAGARRAALETLKEALTRAMQSVVRQYDGLFEA